MAEENGCGGWEGRWFSFDALCMCYSIGKEFLGFLVYLSICTAVAILRSFTYLLRIRSIGEVLIRLPTLVGR